MNMPLYFEDFPKVFSELLNKTGVTCYKIEQYTGLDQGYLSCLKNGKKKNPGPEVVVKISIALAHFSQDIEMMDIEDIFNSIGRSLSPKQ